MTTRPPQPPLGHHGLSRRRFLGGGLAAAGLGLAGALSGCSSDNVASGLTVSRKEGNSIDFWNLFGGGDGVRMQQMEDGYRKAARGTKLSAVTLAWGNPYYTKLSLATLGDKPPNVAVAHLTRAKTMIASDLLEELTPDALASVGITPDKLNKRAWEAGLVDGKAYAVPLDTHPIVTFYNTDICKKAGLLDSDGKLKPWTSEEEFMDAMKKAKAVTKAYGGVSAINNETSTPWRIFQSFYSQLGGQVLSDEGTKVVLDDEKAMKVLNFMNSWREQKVFPGSADYQGSIAMFANGQAAFLFQGEWEISTFQTAKMPFSMTLFPNVYGGEKYACQADSHTLVIPKQPGSDSKAFARSLGFIRSMLDQSDIWAAGGHVPAWLPYADSPDFKKLQPQSNYAAAADAAVYDPDGWYSGSGSDFEIIIGSAIGGVQSGQQSAKSAVSQIHAKLGNLANTASPI
ncbi:multiple sugar transport system substrate-binding protein [Motilibacter peucedani]|uniref:Multiple sugar transport system substrate-binding protein n=1 Tax=Motilibacter peucedani TaxID=598650 RepID=A0A420XR68_9ACTN|nr:extracellular solute-binding protein [Motilibacter peucedani]RKS77388.1 multiple sugar transport system substrate-binding protein [Motilibacter peucedani]